jgi:FkbM family methyltransferase
MARRHAPRAAFNYMRRFGRYLDKAAFTPRQVRHTYGGLPLTLSIEDYEARSWYDLDWPALRELKLLASGKLRPGATVFEIGAHQGVVAMMLADMVGPTGRVIAVEADPRSAEIARRNVALNGMHNVEVLHAAVAATPGEIQFTEASHVDRGEPGQRGRTVKAVTVDGMAKEHGVPAVLFIDVEGYECEVLRGAQTVLGTRPDLFIEVHVGRGLESFGGSLGDVLGYLPAASEVYVADPDRGEFVPMASGGNVLESRFFLVAKS